MANIYVTSLYYWGNPTDEERQILKETYELSRDSYLENLADIDEHILFTNPGFDGEDKGRKTPPHGDVFHDMFLKTYDLWKQGHNIFYADIDTICIHPIKIFGEFNKFTMFNGVIAGPISDNNLEGLAVQMSETINYMPLREGKIGNIEIPTYFNDGVRYFPAETSEKVWEIGEEAWEAWKSRKDMWGEQQIIHNKMLYEGQEWNNDYTTCQRPDLNHFNLGDEHEVLDQPKEYFKDYHIYHLFSSRGLVDCLEAMKEVKHKED